MHSIRHDFLWSSPTATCKRESVGPGPWLCFPVLTFRCLSAIHRFGLGIISTLRDRFGPVGYPLTFWPRVASHRRTSLPSQPVLRQPFTVVHAVPLSGCFKSQMWKRKKLGVTMKRKIQHRRRKASNPSRLSRYQTKPRPRARPSAP